MKDDEFKMVMAGLFMVVIFIIVVVEGLWLWFEPKEPPHRKEIELKIHP